MRANFLFLFILITTRLFSQDLSTNFVQEKDLTQYFYYYDLLDHTMLPYVETDEKKILYLTLKKEECVNKSITFESFKGLRFFVNGSFVEEYEAANEVVLLIAATDFNSSGVLVLAFYHEKGVAFNKGVWLVEHYTDRGLKNEQDLNYGIPRFQSESNSTNYIVLIFVCVVLAYMRYIQSPYIYAYFDVSKFVSRLGVEDFIVLNPFSKHSLIILFLTSLFYAVGLSNLGFFFGGQISVVLIGGVVFIGVLLKYIFLFVINVLYGDNKLFKVHFFEFARFFTLFSVLFLFSSINQNNIFIVALCAIYILWFFWLLIVVVRRSKYRKMYLISYLCISELFPVFILLKQMGDW